jgi:hypothetical protein
MRRPSRLKFQRNSHQSFLSVSGVFISKEDARNGWLKKNAREWVSKTDSMRARRSNSPTGAKALGAHPKTRIDNAPISD